MSVRAGASPALSASWLDGPSAGSTPETFEEALARAILAEGLIDSRGLDRARRVAADGKARLDAVLTQLGLITERSLAETVGRLLDLELAQLADYPDTAVLVERLRPAFLRKARAIPLAADEGRVTLAMADPLDRFTRAAVAAATGREVGVRVALPGDIETALNRIYGDGLRAAAPEDAAEAALAALGEAAVDDTERLRDLASEAPVIRLVNQMISRAVETRASDIHVEAGEGGLRVRYRYDGVLHEVDAPPPQLQAAIVSRIKIMARLDIAERRLPQDGRIKLAVRGQEVDFRIATIPSLHGESVVLRVLDRSVVELRFDRLGLDDSLAEPLKDLLDLPNGIILVTGPTGSGKTTTLYTSLTHLNSVTRKIITVEDPIEYQLAGINQIQVRPQIGLSFATLLRSILRHDPDVIMVGEIRDIETAQIAVQAALTGHLVLSTLHTNGAAATVVRLRDMGLEDYLVAATLDGVLAQRLVRRLCVECRRPAPPVPEVIARFGLDRHAREQPILLYEPVGCTACRGTGFKGRTAIGELLRMSEPLQRLLVAGADQGAIQRAAVEQGMRTMYEHGIAEILAGRTTLREMLRSVRADD
jgi:general secretion pathway protein E